MILNCPSCYAKFMISSEALGENGREVRCGKCGHMWFQAGGRDSLDALASEEPTSRFEEAQRKAFDGDIGFEPHVDKPEEIPPSFKEPFRHRENIEIDMRDTPDTSPPIIIIKQKLRHVASVMAALAIVSVLFYGFVVLKNPLGKSIPFFASAYGKLGFGLEMEKPKIAFDRFKVTRAGTKLTGSLYLINLTSEDVSLEQVNIYLTDLDDKILKSTDTTIQEKTLKSESSHKIDFSFMDVPRGAVSVRASIAQ